MNEIWKDIPGYEGHYQASDLGRIRSIKKEPYIILKTDFQKNGYERTYTWVKGKKKTLLIHRAVAKAFVPNPNGLNEINHIDENKANNKASNLQWCTHSYNLHYGHAIEKISASHKGKKLSQEHIEKLRKDSANKRWMNNGKRESFVKKENLNTLLHSGWKMGRLKKGE